ncbi:MAG: histidinol dehydrogenase, partial [Clostridia bacterium]|nr:histidinol dehydrogenase [Clostridia bacterium]
MIKPVKYRGQSADELFGNRAEQSANVEEAVKKIIENVRLNGDKALKEYAEKFDGFTGSALEVKKEEFDEAEKAVSAEYISTLKRSIKNITAFHEKQLSGGFEITGGGVTLGQKITPVSCAGIYVPGGTAAYPSTVLMNAIPAKIAGVENLVMVTPVKADGKVRAEVLCAAKLCGVNKVFKIGGSQAIAALAYGTQTIPKADKITGPGNVFVATAKKLVSGVCGIDMVAG